MKERNSLKSEKLQYNRIIFDVLIFIYAVSLWVLFYNQLLYPITGRFESDTAVHVRFAVEEGYYHSLAAFIYVLLSKLPLENFTISLVLSITAAATVAASKLLIDRIEAFSKISIPEWIKYVIAFFGNFVMGFYISAANRQHYIGYENANMWHNSTYIFMRLFAVLVIAYLLEIFDSYRRGIRLGQWLIFSLLLSAATGFKASFLTVFAPLLALVLLADLCTKKVSFINAVKMGTSVFPSLIIMYAQSRVLAVGGESNGFVISPFTALSMRGDHPKATLILSVLFPLLMIAFHVKDFYKDKLYFATLVMWAIAFLEVFLLAESGERKLDSNLMWGYSIALFFVFIESMIKLVCDYMRLKDKSKIKANVIGGFLFFVLLWHFISGVWYYILLFSGVTYFI